jgi:inosine-uridine nucleoside N-ribohydrolase
MLAAVALLLVMASPTKAAAIAAPAPKPIPVIIDTDVGDDIDDAFALAVALSDPRVEVVGVTTAFGDTRTRVLLVRRLLAAMGRTEAPVAQGEATDDATPFTQKTWALGAADQSPAPDAVDFIRAQAARRPGQITLIELAPMTNLRTLLLRDPAAFRQLKQVVLMGGSIARGYNTGGAIPKLTPDAEYNIAQAPAAFAALLTEAGPVPVRIFPLDSTQVKFDETRRDRLFAYGSGATDALTLLYHQWRLYNAWGQITPTLFDVVPVAWLIDPSICALTPLHIAVDAKGFTRPAPGAPNAEACLAGREDAVSALVVDDLAPAPRKDAPK